MAYRGHLLSASTVLSRFSQRRVATHQTEKNHGVRQAGLSAEEFQLVVVEVAREADRLEYAVSGSDDRY